MRLMRKRDVILSREGSMEEPCEVVPRRRDLSVGRGQLVLPGVEEVTMAKQCLWQREVFCMEEMPPKHEETLRSFQDVLEWNLILCD